MNWRYALARIKWLINIPERIRYAERERCIKVLCNHDLGTVMATLCNGRLEEQWIRSLLHSFIPFHPHPKLSILGRRHLEMDTAHHEECKRKIDSLRAQIVTGIYDAASVGITLVKTEVLQALESNQQYICPSHANEVKKGGACVWCRVAELEAALQGVYDTLKGYQDVCWNFAADALHKPRPK